MAADIATENIKKWSFASDLAPETEHQAEQRQARDLGSLALAGSVEVADIAEFEPGADNEATLFAAVQRAALGDERALKLVETNVLTDMAERMYKVAHQTEVELQFAGLDLWQNGVSLSSLHDNTLRHATLNSEMRRLTVTERKNALWLAELHQAGVLQTHDALMVSPSSTMMSQAEKRQYGYFVDTESCSIQLLRAEGDKAVLQTAMVAGKKTPESSRHDMATIRRMAETAGLALHETDSTEVLSYIMLVPKEHLPNGVSDVVRMYDDAAGDTFYGQDQPRQDYLQYAEQCRQRNESFGESVEKVVSQLVAEAHLFTSPMQVLERLDKLSEQVCVTYAISNQEVNAAVFGEKAAMHIQDARFFAEHGDMARAEQSMERAKETARSSSCPLFKGSENGPGGGPDSSASWTNGVEASQKKWMHCPYCSARVFDDPCAKILSCRDCHAMVVNGSIKSTGNGGSRARKAERQAAPVRSLFAFAT